MYKIVKLTNGTEIIGDVLFNNEDPHLVAVDKPMQINYRVFQNVGFPSISLIRYSLLADNNPVIFSAKDIMNIIEPRQKFVDYYIATVDTAFKHYDEIVDEQLNLAIARHSQDSDTPADSEAYKSLLENFDSDIVN